MLSTGKPVNFLPAGKDFTILPANFLPIGNEPRGSPEKPTKRHDGGRRQTHARLGLFAGN
jgi:hypothetical protein